MVNLIIIYKATRIQRLNSTRSTAHKRKAQMTKMILLITFLYIITSLPNIILAGYLYVYFIRFYYGQMITNIIRAIQTFYPAFHTFIQHFSNKHFAAEMRDIISKFKLSHVTVISSNLNHLKSK